MLIDQTIDYFISEARSAFDFLHEKYSFSEPIVSHEDGLGYVRLAYVAKNNGIEIIFDLRDKIVDCYVVKLRRGILPDNDVDDQGIKYREELFSYLVKYHRFRGCISKKPPNITLENAIALDVKGYAQLLESHGKEIVKDKALLIDGPAKARVER